ncbi:MAG: hypothetical protein LC754_00875 [Acidobacteria bacterium]|nr:hypothetical protein [Acidobacteriota bacterium]
MNDNSQTQTKRGAQAAAATNKADDTHADSPRGVERLVNGLWGGQHVRLEVADAGAQIEFDCAHGVLEGPLVLSEGRFEVKGTLVSERGPIRPDAEKKAGPPARYTGSVAGDELTLTVRFEGSDEEIGTYTLKHGQESRLFKCK